MLRLFVVSSITLLCACGDSPTGPQPGLLGRYELTQLDSDIRGVVTDHLAGGARINIELRRNGTASVDLFVPGGRSDGTDLREAVDTRWSIQRQPLTPTLIVTTLWVAASSTIVSSGWRVGTQMLLANPPSCSMEYWDPSIFECRINAELTKVE